MNLRGILKDRAEEGKDGVRMEKNGEQSSLATTERKRKKEKEEDGSSERQEKASNRENVDKQERRE